jgi:hypothetical protein
MSALLVDDRLGDSLHLAFQTAGHRSKLQRRNEKNVQAKYTVYL